MFFSPKQNEGQKTNKTKKRSSQLYLAEICWVYSCWLALVRLIIQRSNLVGWTSKSRWGDANSRWGDASPLQFKYCSPVYTHIKCTSDQRIKLQFVDVYFWNNAKALHNVNHVIADLLFCFHFCVCGNAFRFLWALLCRVSNRTRTRIVNPNEPFHFGEPEPNLNQKNFTSVNLNQTWTLKIVLKWTQTEPEPLTKARIYFSISRCRLNPNRT